MMVKNITMGWFGTTHNRITQKVLWELKNKTDNEFMKELLSYINEPDQGLPKNLVNHIQTPEGYGKAKEMIVKCFNTGTTRSLAHAIHYTQDLCNPLHTVKDYPIDKHIVYELMISNVEFEFIPGKVLMFPNGIENGIDSIVLYSNMQFPDLKRAIDNYTIDYIMKISKASLSMAAYSTYGLINIYLDNRV